MIFFVDLNALTFYQGVAIKFDKKVELKNGSKKSSINKSNILAGTRK